MRICEGSRGQAKGGHGGSGKAPPGLRMGQARASRVQSGRGTERQNLVFQGILTFFFSGFGVRGKPQVLG